jgi:phytoene dehydrogenase-like protein
VTDAVLDAVVVGAGPNGLAAAVALAREGHSVRVLEGEDTPGGGTRTQELTQPGFLHDVCSAIHPMGVLSPFLRELPLERHGLVWKFPEASVAHPLADGSAVVLERSLAATGETLGPDAGVWRRLLEPFLREPEALLRDLLAPLRFPSRPLAMARFGALAWLPATRLARIAFRGERARALFAGCAAHSLLPLEKCFTSALGLVFAITGHLVNWPCARGGSRSITDALASLLRSLGGEIETGRRVRVWADLPPSRVVLFDTSPDQLAGVAAERFPARYRRRLLRYRFGPGAFKLDWALAGPIPWKATECARASTVHVGGSLEEIAASERAAWQRQPAERPFLLVCQQSSFDSTRAPEGHHTGYAYCHVPHGCEVDMTQRIEAQIERFAPGFRDLVLARHVLTPADFARHDPNFVGGAITGGAADWRQLFTRPVARLDPYSTPDPRTFLCSASTPPGGGVHGMCGYWAAQSALRRLRGDSAISAPPETARSGTSTRATPDSQPISS